MTSSVSSSKPRDGCSSSEPPARRTRARPNVSPPSACRWMTSASKGQDPMDLIVFPHSRNVGMVERIAQGMATKGSIDAAEDELAFVLEVVAGKLESIGVADLDI